MQNPEITKKTITAAGPFTEAPYKPFRNQPRREAVLIPSKSGNRPIWPMATQQARMKRMESSPLIRVLAKLAVSPMKNRRKEEPFPLRFPADILGDLKAFIMAIFR
jgi:hypothetical protein